MAKVIREERVVDEPTDRVVVDNRDDRPRSNAGLVIGIIIVVLIILFLMFGRSFGGGSTNVNVPAPKTPNTSY
jgi:hypothetical protein